MSEEKEEQSRGGYSLSAINEAEGDEREEELESSNGVAGSEGEGRDSEVHAGKCLEMTGQNHVP